MSTSRACIRSSRGGYIVHVYFQTCLGAAVAAGGEIGAFSQRAL